MVNTLDNFYFSQKENGGLILPFDEVAKKLHVNAGKNYVSINQTHNSNRLGFAAPKLLTAFRTSSGGPNIVADSMIIKLRNSFDVALPQSFNFVAECVSSSAIDLLKTYGADAFRRSEISLIVQRSDIKPDEVHRPDFQRFHNHLNDRTKRDLLYGFYDVLPTEFKLQNSTWRASNNSIVRFGAEINHRSVENGTNRTVRRTWGAIMVNNQPGLKNGDDQCCNIALYPGTRRNEFITNGSNLLGNLRI